MTAFVPDTNVWIDARNSAGLTSRFEKALAAGDKFLIGPPALLELVRGTVRDGGKHFSEDQKTYMWMKGNGWLCAFLNDVPYDILSHSQSPDSTILPNRPKQLSLSNASSRYPRI